MSNVLPLFLTLLTFPQSTPTIEEWNRVRSKAEAQHEIIVLLMDQGQWDRILLESRKLFSIPMPAEQEHRLVGSARVLTKKLHQLSKNELSQKVLDEAIRGVKTRKSKSELCKEKAYLYNKMGQKDEAMRFFEKSLEFGEPKSP